MGNLSPEAVQHAIPFAQLLVAVVVVLVALIGGLWRGFKWLDGRMDARIGSWSESKGFRAAVAEIVSQASSGWNDLYNRQLEDVRRSVNEMRERDAERADSVKRAHQRIDSLLSGKGGAT